MAQKPDGKSSRTERVTFTRPAAERIAKVVRSVEQGSRDCGPLEYIDSGSGVGSAVKVGKTTAAWFKNSVSSIALVYSGTPPGEQVVNNYGGTGAPEYVQGSCVNKFADIAANRWVVVAKAQNGYWYLIAAEC